MKQRYKRTSVAETKYTSLFRVYKDSTETRKEDRLLTWTFH